MGLICGNHDGHIIDVGKVSPVRLLVTPHNNSLGTDTQQQVVAVRHVLRVPDCATVVRQSPALRARTQRLFRPGSYSHMNFIFFGN